MAVIDLKKAFTALTSFVILGFSAIPASAEDYAAAQQYLHTFNSNFSVYTTVFALNKDVSLDTSAYFKYNLDVIEGKDEEDVSSVSSASAAASASSDTRNAFTAGVSHDFKNIAGVEVYYDYSKEQDYTSNTPTITLKKDLFEKNTTLTLGYSRNSDDISGKFLEHSGERTTDNYFFGITQVISPVTVAQLGYSRNISYGLHSEGIRLVPINGAATSSCAAKSANCVNEVFPGSRQRKGYIFNVNHYLGYEGSYLFNRASVKVGLRYYEDDWSIDSYTSEFEYNKYLTESTILRLNYRYYTQTKAFFQKDDYTSADYFMTSSPQHKELDTHLTGVKVTHRLGSAGSEGKNLFSGVFANAVEGKYEYYGESTGGKAHILMGGVRFVF